MCPSAPRVCSEPGGQKPVLSLSLDLIDSRLVLQLPTGDAPTTSEWSTILLSGEPDYFGRNKISSGGDLSHYSSASLY